MEVEKLFNVSNLSNQTESNLLHPFLALKNKKKRSFSKDVAQSLMGVSTVLKHARSVITLEDGEHEVVESAADGTYQYQIDGEELTFDSWSKFSGSDDSVVTCKNKRQFRSKINPTPNILRIQPPPPFPNLQSLSLDQTTSANTAAGVTNKRKRQTSLEEGEIASWSTDDESDIEMPTKKSKLAETSERQKRPNIQSSNYHGTKQRMNKFYNNRIEIVSDFNTSQKVQMAQSLQMVYCQRDEIMKSNAAKFLADS